ncbi:MAG: OmpA family protein [Deltaproteobacteria bacterium]|nr:OmpA family protein [Deltaproteobacteria bacterium]
MARFQPGPPAPAELDSAQAPLASGEPPTDSPPVASPVEPLAELGAEGELWPENSADSEASPPAAASSPEPRAEGELWPEISADSEASSPEPRAEGELWPENSADSEASPPAAASSPEPRAEEVQSLTEAPEDLERRLILQSEGLLDEPTELDLDSHQLEAKLLDDLETFFSGQSLEDAFEADPALGPESASLGDWPKPGEDFLDWDTGDPGDDDAGDDPSLWPSPPEEDSDLGQVRRLLVGRELAQLAYFSRVLTRPAQRAEFISRVITEAILLRTRRDEKLSTVLAPTVERIVTASVRRDPETLASQIFPAIGPAIRRSISETFVSKLQDLNSTLETSLSLRGLKWRLEALRAHKPFSEIVLLNTLLYHIEEIYLIHASTGLVLDHLISEEGGEGRDPDMVAGMFTAIQDFVRDSFKTTQQESLDTLRFGDRSIFLRRTSQVYLACVVRGNPPESLNKDLQEALELMVVDCAEDLDNFNGDASPFRKSRVYFQDFLRARYQDKPKKLSLLLRLAPWLILGFIVVFGLIAHFQNKRLAEEAALLEAQKIERQEWRQAAKKDDRRRFHQAVGLLNAEPGLVVVLTSETTDGRWEIVCLKDSLARDPVEILTQEGQIPANRFIVNVRPFISLDETIVRRRVREVIKPLPSVELAYDPKDGRLSISGTAPMGWILAARERAQAISGVGSVSTEKLVDPRSSEVDKLVSAINGTVIHFPTNKDEPVPEDRPVLIQAVDNLVALEKLAEETQMAVSLVIYGHADSTGADRRNYELSQNRTKTVAALLYARGSSMPISNYGLGSQFSSRGEGDEPLDDPDSRRIELRVRLTHAGRFGSGEAQ